MSSGLLPHGIRKSLENQGSSNQGKKRPKIDFWKEIRKDGKKNGKPGNTRMRRTEIMSAVENGKKNVPADWIDKIIVHYGLSNEEAEELYRAVEESKTQVKLNLMHSSLSQRAVAVQFARSFEGMDDETAARIMEILERGSD